MYNQNIGFKWIKTSDPAFLIGDPRLSFKTFSSKRVGITSVIQRLPIVMSNQIPLSSMRGGGARYRLGDDLNKKLTNFLPLLDRRHTCR